MNDAISIFRIAVVITRVLIDEHATIVLVYVPLDTSMINTLPAIIYSNIISI